MRGVGPVPRLTYLFAEPKDPQLGAELESGSPVMNAQSLYELDVVENY